MATGAADGFFRCVYEGCISGHDNGIQRRPYHRNCGCALHSKSGNKKPCTHQMPRCINVSYPMRRSWSEGSLTLMASASSSPSSSPAAAVNGVGFGSGRHQSGLTDVEEEEENAKCFI